MYISFFFFFLSKNVHQLKKEKSTEKKVGGHKLKPLKKHKIKQRKIKSNHKKEITFLAEDKSENKSLIFSEFYPIVLRVMIDKFVCTNHNKVRERETHK